MIPGFSNHGLSGLLAINNEKETSKNIFSYNDKPTPPMNPKKAQKSLYKKEAWIFSVLKINLCYKILCFISLDRGSDFEKNISV